MTSPEGVSLDPARHGRPAGGGVRGVASDAAYQGHSGWQPDRDAAAKLSTGERSVRVGRPGRHVHINRTKHSGGSGGDDSGGETKLLAGDETSRKQT